MKDYLLHLHPHRSECISYLAYILMETVNISPSHPTDVLCALLILALASWFSFRWAFISAQATIAYLFQLNPAM
jgi:hypothetical protein